MLEHAGRYGAFAEAMNAKGIAVIGHDHLGHGKTARPGCLGTFSDRDGAFYVLEDIRRISDFTERQYPSVPHFILGHSMGSFFVRRFLTICGEQVDGAIIMGTGSKPAVVLKLGTMVVRRAIKKEGRDYHNETRTDLFWEVTTNHLSLGKRSMTGCPGTLRKTENTRRIRIAVLSFPMELMRISFR